MLDLLSMCVHNEFLCCLIWYCYNETWSHRLNPVHMHVWLCVLVYLYLCEDHVEPVDLTGWGPCGFSSWWVLVLGQCELQPHCCVFVWKRIRSATDRPELTTWPRSLGCRCTTGIQWRGCWPCCLRSQLQCSEILHFTTIQLLTCVKLLFQRSATIPVNTDTHVSGHVICTLV